MSLLPLQLGVFCVSLTLMGATAPTPEITENLTENHFSAKPLQQIDAIGNVVYFINEILSYYTRNMRSDDNSCGTRKIAAGGHEFVVAQQPRGSCKFCCPITNPTDHIRLYFTNKAKFGHPVRLKMRKKAGALRAAGVDRSLDTVIFVHGFTEHGQGVGARAIRDAYLTRTEDYNIILVDWSVLSASPWYMQAATNVELTGAVLAKFIQFYSDTGELPIRKIHLIGFSLGAHVSGFVGKYLHGTEKLPRITGLDPAFPLFPAKDPSRRLSKSDAEFVDVIHTDGGAFGFPISLGDADFYPNGGGFVQPGCETSKLTERKIIQNFGTCGHSRAWEFYAESVKNPYAFPASKCEVTYQSLERKCRFIVDGYMGFSAGENMTLGDFYLTTNDQSPFGRSAEQQEDDMKAANLLA